MTATPNTTGPSAEARELVRLVIGYRPMNERDWTITIQEREWVALKDRLAIAIDAALSRARDEGRREALEEAANIAFPRHATAIEGSSIEEVQYLLRSRIARGIRALLTPTPQGETKEQQP